MVEDNGIAIARKIFKYLAEYTQLRMRPQKTMDSWEVTWGDDWPEEPEVASAFRPEQEELEAGDFLHLRKPRREEPPIPDSSILAWFEKPSLHDSSLEAPRVRAAVRVPVATDFSDEIEDPSVPKTREILLEDEPETLAAVRRFIVRQWLPWAELDRGRASVQRLYSTLFSWWQRQAQVGEQWELLLTMGLLSWQDVNTGDPVRRPVVVVPSHVDMDAKNGSITIAAQTGGPGPTLELDMIPIEQRPGAESVRRMHALVNEVGDDIWRPEIGEGVFRSIVNTLAADGQYLDSGEVIREASESRPQMAFAPALVLRKRTEKSIYSLLANIEAKLGESSDLPPGIAAVLNIDTASSDVQEFEPDEHRRHSPDPYGEMVFFPKKSNDEQRLIVDRLARSKGGLIVQGPPGTGKSHTIANLVCDLLARGSRVLVTSKGSRALSVLREMLPDDVQELCVLLLGSDRESNQSLERSIRAISQKHETWQPEQSAHKRAAILEDYRTGRSEESQILEAFRELRKAETLEHGTIEGKYEGTLAQIAEQLRSEQQSLGWIAEHADTIPDLDDCPVDSATATSAANLMHRLSGNDVHDAQLARPAVSMLPDVNTLRTLLSGEADAKQRLEASPATAREIPWSSDLEPVAAGIASLRAGLNRFTEAGNRGTVPTRLLRECILGDIDRIRETAVYLKYVLDTVGDGRPLDSLIQLPQEVTSAQARADAMRLRAHLEEGRSLGFGPFRPRLAKECLYLIESVRVDGAACNNMSSLAALITAIDTERLVAEASASLSGYAVPTVGTQQPRIAELRSLHRVVDAVLEIAAPVPGLRAQCAGLDFGFVPNWATTAGLTQIANSLERSAARAHLDQVTADINRFGELAISGGHPLHPAALALAEACSRRDAESYAAALSALSALETTARDIDEVSRARESVSKASTTLASSLFIWGDEDAADHLGMLPDAWRWLRASGWLERVSSPGRHEELSAAMEDNQQRIEASVASLAAELAWNHCLTAMNEDHRRHLVAWSIEMKRLGKGTGKYAHVHRQNAREHMQHCKDVIPAWIMPLYMVAQTLDPQPNMFDVAIVDEASQCGPESLFVAYIARKVIIVGDDQQISPDDVGVKVDAIQALMDLHLEDMPFKGAFGARSSLFDQGKQFFGHPLRLREHFRCMPEIIQFSNDLCYADQPLEPLRQYGSDRLDPVVVRHVPDGFREGKRAGINHNEALAVVDQIAEICADHRYDNKTIGVISLLSSSGQAQYIERMLERRIGAQEMMRRRLTCGDAYDFQGDERDVIVLSMVSAPNQRIGTLSSEADKRRFNVAVSRAKDQLWLFHSVTLDDLGQQCLRRRLLEYCLNPRVTMSHVVSGVDVESLQRTARRPRSLGSQPTPFDSWFEVDVFLAIVNRGYRVIPQYEVGGYHIDLMIQGMNGSLAVECDGEAWHGIERYDADLARQRKLERCGLRFWRLTESAFRRDPEGALGGLWARLDELGIRSRADENLDVTIDTANVNLGLPVYTPQLNHSDGADVDAPAGFFRGLNLDVEAVAGLTGQTHDDAWATPFGNLDLETGPAAEPLEEESLTNDARGSLPATTTDTSLGGLRIPHYSSWRTRALQDPREGLQLMVGAGLLEIIQIEGPMTVDRLYRRYAQAAGIARVKRQVRASLDAALSSLLRSGAVTRNKEAVPGLEDTAVVFLTGKPDVVVRERGDRELDEVPPSEMLAMLRRILDVDPRLAMENELMIRRLQDVYGIGRLGPKVRSRFEGIMQKHAMRQM